MTRSNTCEYNNDSKSTLLITQSPSNTFSLLIRMQLQALNWLNIVQINLFLRRQITVTVVVDVGWMHVGEKCKLWVQQ